MYIRLSVYIKQWGSFSIICVHNKCLSFTYHPMYTFTVLTNENPYPWSRPLSTPSLKNER